jgi:hypothetical protein
LVSRDDDDDDDDDDDRPDAPDDDDYAFPPDDTTDKNDIPDDDNDDDDDEGDGIDRYGYCPQCGDEHDCPDNEAYCAPVECATYGRNGIEYR